MCINQLLLCSLESELAAGLQSVHVGTFQLSFFVLLLFICCSSPHFLFLNCVRVYNLFRFSDASYYYWLLAKACLDTACKFAKGILFE